jgi:serine/threonine protein phosphatase PrpC
MSNSLNVDKNKMKLKEKNTFLKTNYKLRTSGTKFNSIGKIISMNYPFIQNNSDKKPKFKDKNFIKAENLFSNNKKEKLQNSNKINVNLSQVYNSQSQNELNKNHQEKKLFGTINHFSVNPSPQKDKNSLPKLKLNIKEDINQLNNTSSQKIDMIYSNYLVNNKFQKQNNNNRMVNQTHNIFFSKSSEKFKKYNKKIGLQENKSNESFTIKNSNNNIENKLFNSSEFRPKYFLNQKNKKKESNRLLNSQEIINDFSNNILNQKSDISHNYIINNYGSYTLAGTDAFGRIKTNQDSYLEKEEENLLNNKEYTFGVFDGHGIQGHLVSEAIKNYLKNCSYEEYQNKKGIISMFKSLSLTIENSNNFDIFCSGSTVVIVHISKEKIICANCGDSRAILINNSERGITALKLSRDHKPNLAEEKKRIIESGGRVDRIYGMGPYRVWFKNGDYPGLAMSRSIGDTLAHKIGVSDIPEIIEYKISKLNPLAIIVASDGVWEFMTNEQIKNIIIKYRNSQDAYLCAKEIVEKSRQIWKGTTYAIDDITCIVSFFKNI